MSSAFMKTMALAGLAATGARASPMPGSVLGGRMPGLREFAEFKRAEGETPELSIEDACGGDLDDRDMTKAADIWDRTGAGVFLDEFIMARGNDPTGWLTDMDDEARPLEEGEGGMDCSDIGTTCNPPPSCKDFYDWGFPQVYWIEYAAARYHSGYAVFWHKATENSLTDGLNINELISEFDDAQPEVGINASGMLAGIFTAASGIAGMFTGGVGNFVSGFAGIAGGVASAAGSAEDEDSDPGGDLQSEVAKAYKAMVDQIHNNIYTAMGFESLMDSADLPAQSGSWSSNIAKVFDGGKFLIENIGTSNYFQTIIDEAMKQQDRVIITALLSQLGNFVMIDTTITNSDDCTSMQSQWWDGTQCFAMWWFDVANGRDPKTHAWPSDGWWPKLQDEYFFVKEDFYPEVLKCAEETDGTGKEGFPDCTFKIPLVKAKTDRRVNGMFSLLPDHEIFNIS